MKQPNVFLSYSHEDHSAATSIANKLQAGGIKVWYDKWEILAGDSLIQKIFEEGLAKADAFIVLLSKHSIASKWVQRELDTALIKRMEGTTRVLPVVLEKVEVPISLKALRWVDLSSDFDSGIRELQMAIFKVYERAPIGEPPAFIKNYSSSIHGLSRLASTMGSYLLKTGKEEIGREESFTAEELSKALEMTAEETDDSIDELETLGLVTTRSYFGTNPFRHGHITPTYALYIHFKDHGLDYDPEEDIKKIANAVALKKQVDGSTLSNLTSLSPLRINRAVDYLADYGIIKIIRTLGTAPFSFYEAYANSGTRRFVSENN